MALTALLQIGLPLALIAWLAIWPQTSRLGITLQIAASIMLLVAVSAAGVWTFIPIWTPYLLGAMLLMAIIKTAWHWRKASAPTAAKSWIAMVFSGLILGAALVGQYKAYAGRTVPGGPTIRLNRPLDGTDLRVANGGANTMINAHADTLDLDVPRHRDWVGQSYGIDIVALHPWGTTSKGLRPTDPTRYIIFGRPVRAPCNGIVIAQRQDRPDMSVPQVDREVMTGNFVTLRCQGIEVTMAHLQRASVTVRVGERVAIGSVIGRVGNSGLSDEPHLHMHAQMPGSSRAPFSGRPIPMLFGGRFLVRNDKV
jgi:Peptidase family M23